MTENWLYTTRISMLDASRHHANKCQEITHLPFSLTVLLYTQLTTPHSWLKMYFRSIRKIWETLNVCWSWKVKISQKWLFWLPNCSVWQSKQRSLMATTHSHEKVSFGPCSPESFGKLTQLNTLLQAQAINMTTGSCI